MNIACTAGDEDAAILRVIAGRGPARWSRSGSTARHNWLSTRQSLYRRAVHRGGAIASGLEDARRGLQRTDTEAGSDPRDALHQLGQLLERLARQLGLDEPRAWALLAVRDDIGSHLLAAHVVESFDA